MSSPWVWYISGVMACVVSLSVVHQWCNGLCRLPECGTSVVWWLMSSLWVWYISGVMVYVVSLSVVHHGFDPWSGQTKDYKIGICWFCDKHATLRSKSRDWLAQNQDNVSKLNNCCFSQLALCVGLVQRHRTLEIQVLAWDRHKNVAWLNGLFYACNM